MKNNYPQSPLAITKLFLAFGLSFVFVQLFAGKGEAKTFFTKDAFQSAVFIKNEGLVEDYNGQSIKYFAVHSHIKSYFMAGGVLFKLQSTSVEKAGAANESEPLDNDEGPAVSRKSSLVCLNWVGANPNAQMIEGQQAPGYHTWLKNDGSGYSSVKAVSYQTITYKDLYPGIDAQFSFPAKGGVKYDLVVHPGADISQVHIQYTGDIKQLEQTPAGDIVIHTDAFDLTDHAPVSYLQDKTPVASTFNLKGNDLQFAFPQGYDRQQTLTVDPWMNVPTTLTPSEVGMDVDFDSAGNTYVYGAGATSTTDQTDFFELAKYDPSGVLQWTFSGIIGSISWSTFSASNGNTNYPGNMYVDKSSQKVYVSKGHDGTATTVVRLNALGIYDNFITATNGSFQEAWGLKYNCVNNTLLALGGGPSSNINMALINTSTGAIDTANVTHVTGGHQDIVCGVFDNTGNLYVIMDGSNPSLPHSNTLYRVDNTSRNYTWVANSTYTNFVEERNQVYWVGANPLTASSNWNNCLAANSSYLYYWDGFYMAAYSLTTGAKVGSTLAISLAKEQGGIAVDNCNNVYAGGDDGVLYAWSFNGTTFTALSNISLPALFSQDNPQDIKYNSNNNLLYVAGGGQDGGGMVGTMVATYSTGCNLIGTSKTCSSATVHVSPTTGTLFNYTWTNSSGTVVSNLTGSTDTTNTANGLSDGTYYIAVEGQANCNGSSLFDSVVISGAGNASVAVSSSCSGDTATASITGGTGPFTYAWSNGASTQMITNVAAGPYTVTVSTGGGCSATASATIVAATTLTLSPPVITNTTCGANNGGASISVATGTGPYTYAWSNSTVTAAISNVGSGTYNVTVTGNGGCSASASAGVGSSTALAVSASATPAGCSGNGSATASVTTGTGPYTYAWSNSGTTATISNISAATYTVTVTGAGGCTATASATVTSSGGALVLSPTSTNATCAASDGSAAVTVTTGTGPFTYLWSNSAATSSISNVPAGNYTVTVTGSGGCSAVDNISVSSTNNVAITATGVTTTCGGTNGSVSVSITSGTGPFTYSWSNSTTTTSLSNVASGTYTVTITNTNNCTASASATVAPSTGVSVTTLGVNTSCGLSNGSATATTIGGTSPFAYSWSNGGSGAAILHIDSGTYTVTVTDAANCTATASVTINPSGNTTVTITQDKSQMCPGDSARICAPPGYTTYAWDDGDNSQCFETTLPGNYYVTVTDNGGCTATSNHLTVAVYQANPVVMTVSGDTLHAYGTYQFQWYFNNNMLTGETGPVLVATQNGQYYVVQTDSNGCVETSSKQNISNVTGIDQITADNGIKVYPNPLQSGSWHLEVSANWVGAFTEIYDAAGRIVYKSEIRETKSDIAINVAQGVYLLRIGTAQSNYALKLIKL